MLIFLAFHTCIGNNGDFMAEEKQLKRIRVWILRYLQFRRLIWWGLGSFVGLFFVEPNDKALYWFLMAILFTSAMLIYIYAVCPVCNKFVHRMPDPKVDDHFKRLDIAFENIKRNSCVHCGYSFSKKK